MGRRGRRLKHERTKCYAAPRVDIRRVEQEGGGGSARRPEVVQRHSKWIVVRCSLCGRFPSLGKRSFKPPSTIKGRHREWQEPLDQIRKKRRRDKRRAKVVSEKSFRSVA